MTVRVIEVSSWKDSQGVIHPTKEAALLAEIERAIGKVGNGESLTPGIARTLVENREQLIELLSEFGAVQCAVAA